MRAICLAIGITGLLVLVCSGQSTMNTTNRLASLIVPPAPVATQPAAQVSASVPVVLPFLTNSTARTPAGITNSLIRWGAWIPGAKDQALVFPTDRAVLAALNWLQREQQADGSWKGSQEIVTPTLTALALLAYLGHGETPRSAGYGTNISQAIHWLCENQDESGLFQGRDNRNYTHPIAALALTEAYGLTLDPRDQAVARKAIARIIKGQRPDGGFGFNLDKAARNDTVFMSWCAQALAAARMVKLDVPGLERALDKTSYALRQKAGPNGDFGESGPGWAGNVAAGIVGLQLSGASQVTETLKALNLLAALTFAQITEDSLPAPGTSHFQAAWYMTQSRFQAGEETFRSWNKSLAFELTGSQNRQRNLLTKWVDLGHWQPTGTNVTKEAIIQDTCYGALMLEVYYRYLPQGK
ncbi:MAG: prenyltransferase/squalene oxidase repeat-containing protein [Kiritimatiellia bacterium]